MPRGKGLARISVSRGVDPHGPAQVQKSISSGPISIARPSPHHGGRHTIEHWKEGLALCMQSLNARAKGW